MWCAAACFGVRCRFVVRVEAADRFTDRIGLGVLTRVVGPDLVDEVLVATGWCEKRRLLPARVVVYFVLALTLFFDDAEEVRFPSYHWFVRCGSRLRALRAILLLSMGPRSRCDRCADPDRASRTCGPVGRCHGRGTVRVPGQLSLFDLGESRSRRMPLDAGCRADRPRDQKPPVHRPLITDGRGTETCRGFVRRFHRSRCCR
jgi:hypothetical protein